MLSITIVKERTATGKEDISQATAWAESYLYWSRAEIRRAAIGSSVYTSWLCLKQKLAFSSLQLADNLTIEIKHWLKGYNFRNKPLAMLEIFPPWTVDKYCFPLYGSTCHKSLVDLHIPVYRSIECMETKQWRPISAVLLKKKYMCLPDAMRT